MKQKANKIFNKLKRIINVNGVRNLNKKINRLKLSDNFIGYFRPCDIVTLIGALISFVGIVLAVSHYYIYAALCLAISGICDGLDGKVARKHKYNSDKQVYGTQLDSLSDVICFGLFPALFTSVICGNIFGYIAALFYLICGITRLAYFNMLMNSESSNRNVFIGVPITTIAIIYPLLILGFNFIDYNFIDIILPIFMILIGIAFILKIEIKKVDIVGKLSKIFNNYTVNFLFFPLFLILGADLFYKISFNDSVISSFVYMINTIFDHFLPFIYVILIVGFIMLILTALLNNVKWAKIILLVIFVIFLTVNDIKFQIMGLPIQISDVNYLNPDNVEMMGVATSGFGFWIFILIIKIILFIGVGIFIVKSKNEINFTVLQRILLGLISLVVIILLLGYFKFMNDFKLKKVYNTNADELLKITDTAKLYNEYGLFQGLFLDDLSSLYLKPTDYDKKSAKKILETAENTSDIKWKKANVVFLLSETFSDAENFSEVKFEQNLTPNLDKFSKDKDKMVFDLLVPTYGGVSVNSEFEVLTGGSLAFWKKDYIPYNQYFNEENSKFMPSVIKDFNDNGYYTMYLTPFGKTSYRSEYVYGLYGVDEKRYGDSLTGKKKGTFYSDKSLMDDIYNELKETSKGNYKFIMAASGQNHTPYNGKYKESEYDVSVKSTSLNEEKTELVRSYAQGIYDADKALNYLYTKIKKLDVPTVIVFFGDHLPYMFATDGTNVCLESNYLNTKSENLNVFRKYTTKAAIVSNYNIDLSDKLEYINASYLGAYVLNKMDIEVSPYFEFVDSVRKITPVFNRNTIYDLKTNKFISVNDADKRQIKNLNNYKNVQHYSFYEGD